MASVTASFLLLCALHCATGGWAPFEVLSWEQPTTHSIPPAGRELSTTHSIQSAHRELAAYSAPTTTEPVTVEEPLDEVNTSMVEGTSSLITDVLSMFIPSKEFVLETAMSIIATIEGMLRTLLMFIPGMGFVEVAIQGLLKVLSMLRSFHGIFSPVTDQLTKFHPNFVNLTIWIIENGVSYASEITCIIFSVIGGYDSTKCSTCLGMVPDYKPLDVYSVLENLFGEVFEFFLPRQLFNVMQVTLEHSLSGMEYLDGLTSCTNPNLGRVPENCVDLKRDSVIVNLLAMSSKFVRTLAQLTRPFSEIILLFAHGITERVVTIFSVYRTCLYEENPLLKYSQNLDE